MTPPRSTRRRYLLAFAGLLASCLHPPAVSPTQTLSVDTSVSGPRTRGSFAVVFAAPRGTVANRAEPGVTVLFNRAMRLIDDDEQARIPAITVRTDTGADVAGSWRWIGTHGLLFVPATDLRGATRFRVTVPRGTHSVENESLASDYSFVFATPRPNIVESSPTDGQADLRPDAKIRIDFNQRIDPDEVARAVHLSVGGSEGSATHEVPFLVSSLPATMTPLREASTTRRFALSTRW